MNKTQIIASLVLLLMVGLIFAYLQARNDERYYIMSRSAQIGRDLIAATNSELLVEIGPKLNGRLKQFLGSPAGFAAVSLADEPKPIGDGSAHSRVFLTNGSNECLGIRLRQDSIPDRFQVLSFWTEKSHTISTDR